MAMDTASSKPYQFLKQVIYSGSIYLKKIFLIIKDSSPKSFKRNSFLKFYKKGKLPSYFQG